MNLTFTHPRALFLIPLVLPAVIIAFVQFGRIVRNCALTDTGPIKHILKLRRRIILRIFCWAFAWVSLCLALSGPAWGTMLVPVQKSGAAVSFVFDISYSMCAEDTPYSQTSRLEAAGQYAQSLLDHMSDTTVSVVLAKGDGVIAIPLTEDFNAAKSLLSALSPMLMSSAGSSLGSGVDAAVRSFPIQAGRHSSIVVFTDGDETDGRLEAAIEDALKNGFSVIIIGFGSVHEVPVIAGDGETTVMTALREDSLRKTVEKANRSIRATSVSAQYIAASEVGSALTILKTICPYSITDGRIETGYEEQSVQRYPLFIELALVLFLLGLLLAEYRVKPQLAGLMLICLFLPAMQGCSGSLKNAGTILKSTADWYRHDYQGATAGFLEATETALSEHDVTLLQYGLYGLSSAYMMQDENEAALERINEISADAPSEVRFSAWYNAGIIAYKKGEFEAAAHAFRQALLVDNTVVDAKINLEISLSQKAGQVQSGERELEAVSETSEDSARQDVIFSLIRENEQNKWKTPQNTQQDESVLDY